MRRPFARRMGMKTVATTVQAVTAALRSAGFTFYKRPRRGPVQDGIRVVGHHAKSYGGRGLICVHTDTCAIGDAEKVAREVAATLNTRAFSATFDPNYGPITGVVFVTAVNPYA